MKRSEFLRTLLGGSLAVAIGAKAKPKQEVPKKVTIGIDGAAKWKRLDCKGDSKAGLKTMFYIEADKLPANFWDFTS